MHLVPLQKDQYGTFYEGDSYLLYVASEPGKTIEPGAKVRDLFNIEYSFLYFYIEANFSVSYRCMTLKDVLKFTFISGLVQKLAKMNQQLQLTNASNWTRTWAEHQCNIVRYKIKNRPGLGAILRKESGNSSAYNCYLQTY